MIKHEMGRFYVTIFDKKMYEFIVNSDATMDYLAICAEYIYRIVIKPRFELFIRNCSCVNPTKYDGTLID